MRLLAYTRIVKRGAVLCVDTLRSRSRAFIPCSANNGDDDEEDEDAEEEEREDEREREGEEKEEPLWTC
jgi:hypothetical protein